MIKIDTHILRISDSSDFDYTTLDYIDISKNIKKGIS